MAKRPNFDTPPLHLRNTRPVLDFLDRKALDQKDLAALMPTPPGHLSRILSGKQATSYAWIARLAEVIGREVVELLIPPEKTIVSREDAEFLERLDGRWERRHSKP